MLKKRGIGIFYAWFMIKKFKVLERVERRKSDTLSGYTLYTLYYLGLKPL